MNTDSTRNSKTKRGAIRWLVRETLGNLILIAILFGIVGRWDWGDGVGFVWHIHLLVGSYGDPYFAGQSGYAG